MRRVMHPGTGHREATLTRLLHRLSLFDAVAYLFGVKPGTAKKEGWEAIVYTTYVASFFVLVSTSYQYKYVCDSARRNMVPVR